MKNKVIKLSIISSAKSVIDAFKNRVSTDSGTWESDSFFTTITTALGSFYNQASLLLTPNAYKSGKIYSAKPTDGTGDFTFTRTTRASRKATSEILLMEANTPRLDYLNNTLPSVLLEPARTNLLLKSGMLTQSNFTKIASTVPVTGNTGVELSGSDNIWVEGNYAYVASNAGNCVSIIDISTPSNPQFVSKIINGQGGALLEGAIGIQKNGNYLYVSAIVSNAVEVIDVSNPLSPTHAGSIVHGAGGASLTSPWNLFILGNYCYVTVNHALEILDITSPTAPVHAGTLANGSGGALLSTPLAVKVVGNFAYVASSGSNALEIVNVTVKTAPVHAASVADGAGGAILTGAHGLWVEGNYAYVCARTGNAISIFDVSNPLLPSLSSTLVDGSGGAELTGVTDVFKVGNYLYLVCFDGNAFEVVDVTTPASPTHVSKILDGAVGALLYFADDIFVLGNYAYTTSYYGNGINVINISTPSSPIQTGKITNLISYSKVLETTANSAHLVRQAVTKAASALSYVAQAVVKGGLGRDWVVLQLNDAVNVAGKFFNITTGALGNDRIVGSNFTIQDSKITSLGNGEYLISVRVTSTTSTTLNTDLLLSTDGSTISYVGDAAKGVYCAFLDVIQSASPLLDSYTPTALTSFARSADVISPLTGVTSLIGQTEGTIFLWIRTSWADSVAKNISLSDGTTNNVVSIVFTTGNLINCLVKSGGVSQASISNGGFSNLTEYKIAITYQNNKAALFVNGSKIGEDLSVTVPACSRIGFDDGAGSNPFYGNIDAFSISKTALSDADAQTLTT